MGTENYYPIVFDNGSSFNITNSGTAPSPCKITIVPKVDFVTLTIEGLSEKPISMSGIHTNDMVVIDGEQRVVTINDSLAFDKYNGWEFPKLQPGLNTVTVNNGSSLSISVEYTTRYI